ncbi:formate dehydrogenase subunit delta, partial [Vibrio parahaemolyticus]
MARAFAAEGDARAVPQIAEHIQLFWDPRMKTAIFAHVKAGGEGLDAQAR